MGERLNFGRLLYLWSERAREEGYPVEEIQESLDYAIHLLDDPNKVRRLRRAARTGRIWPPENEGPAVDAWLYDLIRRALASGWRRDELVDELDSENCDLGIPALIRKAARRPVTPRDIEMAEAILGRPLHMQPGATE